ncbi:hypothetical protein LIER_25159 [Lithospermum erythrorhizon]|uniref:Uncharacterized protein n=1 Tax=Lithospermum erythrorhizon TaxID=34254 RepID=A0AAV3R595_LITER
MMSNRTELLENALRKHDKLVVLVEDVDLANDSHFATHRFKNGERLQVSSKLDKNVIFASSNNPPEGSDIVEKMENSTAKGPPFLTILAGLLVFAAVCWVLGSIVMWLIGLVINLSPK